MANIRNFVEYFTSFFKDTPEFKATVNDIPVLTELPEPDASKAGQEFSLNGTRWTYVREGEFGSLDEGTPLILLPPQVS